MKLKELAIEGYGAQRNLHLGKLSDGMSIVYGENGAGKSTVRKFLRGTLFGFEKDVPPCDHSFASGRINVLLGDDEFQLARDFHPNAPLDVHSLSTATNSAGCQSILDFPDSLSGDLYDTVFNVSFRETPTNIFRLSAVLKNELGIATGPHATGEAPGYVNWKHNFVLLQERLESVAARVASLSHEKSKTLEQIESAIQTQENESALLKSKIHQHTTRINEIEVSPVQLRLANIEGEIERVRQAIDHEQEQQNSNPAPPSLDDHWVLYQRLDEIEDQIQRWRGVQSEIQNQRIHLRDEMLVWNELTLESDQHPYHQARAILVALESNVDEAERNANHWSDVGGPQVDTSQMTRTLTQICHRMRDDLLGMCSELAHQYKHLRHKSAAAELKRLRRSYSDMGENISHLIHLRIDSIDDIRKVNPLGADAISRAEYKFCQCSHLEGSLEACKRFVDPYVANPAARDSRIASLDSMFAHLADLEQLRVEQVSKLAQLQLEHGELSQQKAQWVIQHDQRLAPSDSTDLTVRISAIDSELHRLEMELASLSNQVEQERLHVPTPPHSILKRASELLSIISNKDLVQVFLDEPVVSPINEMIVETMVRERNGNVVGFASMSPGLQDQIYICLILATKEHLKLKRIETPTIIDDAFLRIPPERVTATLGLLQEFAANGHQIIALTQHRYLSDRIQGLPVFELAPAIASIQPDSRPDRQPIPFPNVSANIFPNVSANVGTDRTGNAFHRAGTSSEDATFLPYPLSKYYRASSNDHPEPRTTTTVPVSIFADPIGFVPGVEASTRLDQVGIFDAVHLRIIEDHAITSVGQFLALDFEQALIEGIHRDQLVRWQSQLQLLWSVPGMRIDDARVLVACGITDPEQLDTSHAHQIQERIQRLFSSTEGRHFATHHDSITVETINGWYRALEATRSRWKNRNQAPIDRQTSGFQPRAYQPDESPIANEVRQVDPRPVREPRLARPPRMNTPIKERKIAPRLAPVAGRKKADVAKTIRSRSQPTIRTGGVKLKFLLDLSDHIEAAPSIGPKTAERFEKIGVVTVQDFLKQTAESMATKLQYKRISADLICQWQQQARLICRIPNLRNHDAQLLVACNVWEPEDLASMQPKQLFEVIGPFSETKEGMKIIRNGKKPDLAEITSWISWAAEMRSIQAA